MSVSKAINELSSNCSPEAYIDAAFMAVESIKAIASQMSPETGQRLTESGITTTPREALRHFTISHKELPGQPEGTNIPKKSNPGSMALKQLPPGRGQDTLQQRVHN